MLLDNTQLLGCVFDGKKFQGFGQLGAVQFPLEISELFFPLVVNLNADGQ